MKRIAETRRSLPADVARELWDAGVGRHLLAELAGGGAAGDASRTRPRSVPGAEASSAGGNPRTSGDPNGARHGISGTNNPSSRPTCMESVLPKATGDLPRATILGHPMRNQNRVPYCPRCGRDRTTHRVKYSQDGIARAAVWVCRCGHIFANLSFSHRVLDAQYRQRTIPIIG